MRNKTSLFKRSMAGLLTLVLVLGMIPAMNWIAKAVEGEVAPVQETGPQGNYITLPITVRDFAADGMLFEYNEVDRATFTARNDDGTFTWGNTNKVTITDRLSYDQTGVGEDGAIDHSVREPFYATYNPTAATVEAAKNIGIYVLSKGTAKPDVFADWWYCLIIDASGNILKVLPAGTSKDNFDADMATTYKGATPAYSIWAWRDPINLPYYHLLAKVTDDNMDQYQIGFDNGVSTTVPSTAGEELWFYLGTPYKTTIAADHMGIYAWSGDNVPNGYENYPWWTRIICDNNNGGQIVDIIPAKTPDSTYGTSDYNIVMIHADDSESLEKFSHITTDNMSEYQIVIPSCDVGGALFIERTITMHEANTRGFGLLFTKSSDMFHNLYDDPTGVNYGTIAGTLLEDNDPSDIPGDFGTNVSPYKTVYIWSDEANLAATERVSQDLYYGTIRTGLVSTMLDEDTHKPVYTDATVNYLADYMSKVMPYGESYNGNYYSFHVMGVKMFREDKSYAGPGHPEAVYDLADLIRFQMDNSTETNKMGTPSASAAKFKAGDLSTYAGISTWCDAAYFLLHNTWQDSSLDVDEKNNDGYGMPMPNYHSLHLMETTNADGQTCYVFNAKYSNTVYDSGEGEIYNTPFDTYTAENRPYTGAYDKNETTETTSSGIKLPYLRFDPLGPASTGGWQGYKKAGSMNTYGELTGSEVSQNWSEYYDDTNYHLSLEGHAQFVYQYDANQYFTFTGDDDVYLYINGYRVLDIGGAHGIAKVRIDVNDVAKKIGLQNGGTYNFDFFYMERHGTAANFGIETNIQIADASMHTAKQGFQNGVNTGYGGPVNADNHVGYTFELENNGSANLTNLTFNDPNLDVYFGYDQIRPYPLDAEGNEVTTNHPYTIEKDLYLIRYNSTGGIVEYLKPGEVTKDILIDRLTNGLASGEKIGIYGIKYKIKPEQWGDTDGDKKGDTFINTVYTTASDGTKTLQGVADWKVVRMEHPYEAFHVYDWVHKKVSNDPADAEDLIWKTPTENGIPVPNGVTVPKADLISKYLLNGKNNELLSLTEAQKNGIQITLCTAAGNEDPYFLQGSNAKLDSATGGITYTSKTVGKDTVFFKFKNVAGNAVYDSLVFSYEVYTYGAVDNIYVLDYGLPVELAGSDFGFYTNDHLELNENNREMKILVTGTIEANDNDKYGIFTWDQEKLSLKYTPTKIINDTDEVYAKFRIKEMDSGDPSIYNSVEMVQKITTAPASVMYYEENFPGITYCDNKNGNEWVHYETQVQKKDENDELMYDEEGNPIYESVAGTEQSAEQETNYGSDPNYSDDKVGNNKEEETIVFTADTSNPNEAQKTLINKLAQFLGLTSQDSNGTYNKLEVKKTEEVMSFEFKGTGFEIISRTTKDQYALIQVNVYLLDENGDPKTNLKDKTTGKLENPELPATNDQGLCRTKIVITESKGGDLYQVPIIAFKDLPRSRYKVTVKASSHDQQPRTLYIDGIRIYGPLSNTEALEYYNPQELGAEYYEVKNLIAGYHAVYVDMTATDGEVELYTGGTVIENTKESDDYVLVNEKPDGTLIELTDYLSCGPNNEIYLDGNNSTNLIAFFLVPDDKVSKDERTVQIGAHRKADEIAEHDGSVSMFYGSTADDITNGSHFHAVKSGTEQYFDINVDNLKQEDDGRYLVIIAAGEGDYGKEVLTLTNLKIKGYEVELAKTSLYAANENGTLAEHIMVKTVAEILGVEFVEDSDESDSGTEGELDSEYINQDLEIINAALQSDAVASGKRATLAVSTTLNAEEIEVLDAEGNLVTSTSLVRTVRDGKAVFTFLWRVYGSRGDKQVYTVRVKDADGKYSANTMTVTVTIK